jgi:SAM-dependent methyltransferase
MSEPARRPAHRHAIVWGMTGRTARTSRWPDRLQRLFWNLHSRTWDDYLDDAAFQARIDETATWLARGLASGASIIDLGCGTGNHTRALAGRGLTAIGVDSARGMVRRAAPKRSSRALFAHADLRSLPFVDHSIDAALAVYSFQLLDLDAVLPEVRRVLRPGGHLIVEVPRPGVRPRRPLADMPLHHRVFQHATRAVVYAGLALGTVNEVPEDAMRSSLASHRFTVVGQRDNERSYILRARAERPARLRRG